MRELEQETANQKQFLLQPKQRVGRLGLHSHKTGGRMSDGTKCPCAARN